MNREKAEQLIKLYKEALFSKFKDWGDHPSQTEVIDQKLKEIEELLIKELTDSRMPIG
jgi:hypothetical protein